MEGPARKREGDAQRLGQVLLKQVQRRRDRRGRHKFRRRARRRGPRRLLQLDRGGGVIVIVRWGRLSVSSRKNYEPGVATCGGALVLCVCVCVQPSAPLGTIPRRPDPSGARCARIGKHETFLAGVLARGQELTTRLPTCHLVCQPFSSRGPCFEPGRWPRASRGRLPLSPGHRFFFLSLSLVCP